jgi:hypothetical protein
MVGPVLGKGYYFNSPRQMQGGAEIFVFFIPHSSFFASAADAGTNEERRIKNEKN